MSKLKNVKVWSALLMIVLLSSYAAAVVPQTDVQQTETETTNQLVIGAQDVITASDAGGGTLSSRDLLVMAVIGIGILVLALVIL